MRKHLGKDPAVRICWATIALLTALIIISTIIGGQPSQANEHPTTSSSTISSSSTTTSTNSSSTTTTKPATPSTTVSTIPTTGCPPEISELIQEHFADDYEWALATAWRESNCRPEVVSAEGARGIMQLLGHEDLIANAGGNWRDPGTNIRAARALYEQCGRLPWAAPNYGCEAK